MSDRAIELVERRRAKMNPRIRALMDEAKLQAYYDAQQDHIEKFAELIIHECLEVVEKQVGGGDDTNGQWDKAINFTYDDIEKHFGVAE